ncbi:hypothetical protein GIB67_024978, partial [Kingdonia uniflora]
MVLVSQEPILFASNIRDNIGCRKDDVTLEEIKAFAELANTVTFIEKCLRRHFIVSFSPLMLSESNKSERVMQEALDCIMSNRTNIVVAHRLSTLKNSDTIAVIHLGNIAERGK